jgi:hypothetical protein
MIDLQLRSGGRFGRLALLTYDRRDIQTVPSHCRVRKSVQDKCSDHMTSIGGHGPNWGGHLRLVSRAPRTHGESPTLGSMPMWVF